MSLPDADEGELRYAEYVLGVLEADERAAVEIELKRSQKAASEVRFWESRLMPLVQEIQATPPPPHVWARIEQLTQLPAPSAPTRRSGLWDRLAFWRWLSIGAGVAALALLSLTLWLSLRTERPATYLASTLRQPGGGIGWTATLDVSHARIVVVPAAPSALPLGRAPELWLIPAGARPIPLGMIARTRATTLSLPAAMPTDIGPMSVLAVSIEPPAGSPTGQPTGAVIAQGGIVRAPSGSG
jgi:anti-sigma-K factor RskA